MTEKKILLTGLPRTGKTTFIAALWYMLYHHQEESKLKIGSLAEGDHEYLNKMSQTWMRYEDMGRTSNNKLAGEHVVIEAINKSNEESIILNIPDFSGETFRDHFDLRVWSDDFFNRITTTGSLMLFVSPVQRNNRPKLIITQQGNLRYMGVKPSNDGINFTTYDPKYTPNQVKIVEELQFFKQYTNWQWPLKTAIMISAWDLVRTPGKQPREWLKNHMPLLYQYLVCNNGLFNCRFYGISAQGGNYKKDKEDIADMDPLKRVQLQEGKNYFNDITEPILWLAE